MNIPIVGFYSTLAELVVEFTARKGKLSSELKLSEFVIWLHTERMADESAEIMSNQDALLV